MTHEALVARLKEEIEWVDAPSDVSTLSHSTAWAVRQRYLPLLRAVLEEVEKHKKIHTRAGVCAGCGWDWPCPEFTRFAKAVEEMGE